MMLDDAQTAGLDLDRHLLLDAGAGTGKTTVMAHRYIEHLLTPVQRATRLTAPGPRATPDGVRPAAARVLNEWEGLVPSEVVAITFTVKAADELRARIRAVLLDRAAQGIDVRLAGRDRLVEALVAALDDAPIGTIDSFLQRLVRTRLAWLLPDPPSDLVSDEERLTVASQSRDRLWRAHSPAELRAIGVPGDRIDRLIETRARLLEWSGGRASADDRLAALMRHHGMAERFATKTEGLHGPPGILRVALAQRVVGWASGEIESRLSRIEAAVTGWWAEVRRLGGDLQLAEALEQPTRVEAFATLVEAHPADLEDRLSRLHRWHALLRTTDAEGRLRGTWLPHGLPPLDPDGWPSGLRSARPRDAELKAAVDELRRLLSDARGEVLLALAAASAHLGPATTWPQAPPAWWRPLGGRAADPLPDGREPTVDEDLDLISDLAILADAARAVLERGLLDEGRFDHAQMQQWASELMLERTPRRLLGCSPAVVAALDRGSRHAWSDQHLAAAIAAAGPEDEALIEDAIGWLLSTRRSVRALIVDEFQDTNPAQWSLLQRWLGGRTPAELRGHPSVRWAPTVCLVGDQKQSIYRFREAQVEVMRRAAAEIDAAVVEERGLEPLSDLLDAAGVRRVDTPVPVTTGFRSAGELHRTDTGPDVGASSGVLPWPPGARPGRVLLQRNHRTRGDLLRTVDALAAAILDSSERDLDGGWHASPQPLSPARPEGGALEWLAPPHADAEDGLDHAEREHELLAARLRSILATDGETAPEDVLVLVPRRTHQDDLLDRLARWGIPALPERGRGLMARPIVQDLLGLVQALARPWRAHDVAWLARSPLVGLDDEALAAVFARHRGRRPFAALVAALDPPTTGARLVRWRRLAAGGRLLDVLDEVLDATDLLAVRSEPTALADAERLIEHIAAGWRSVGHDLVRLAARIDRWRAAPAAAFPAPAAALPGAVRVLTVHGSKGLEAPVVALTGLYDPGHQSMLHEESNRILVSPTWIASEWRPWRDEPRALAPLWDLGRALIRSQAIAEQRRLLYVALTRVRERLILVGAPRQAHQREDGVLVLPLTTSLHPSLGAMLQRALQRVGGPAWEARQGDRGPEQHLDPAALATDAHLPPGGLPTLAFWTDPRALAEPPQTLTAVELARRSLSLAAEPSASDPASIDAPLHLRLPAHRLDLAAGCRRRHWLERGLGLHPTRAVGEVALRERLEAEADPRTSKADPRTSKLDPATFGLLIHAILEDGLPRPHAPPDSPLPPSWTAARPNRLRDPELWSRAMARVGAHPTPELTARVDLVTSALDSGAFLDQLRTSAPATPHLNGHTAEWAFAHRHHLLLDPPLSPVDHHPSAALRHPSVILESEGRIDLILAGTDDEGPWLQAIDLKTDGCTGEWPTAPDPLHHLQALSERPADPLARTPAEAALLERHRLQLAHYTRVLDDLERARTAAGHPGRRLLPPAILNAANGRLVARSRAELADDLAELDRLLLDLAHIDAGTAEGARLVRPLPLEQARVCVRCPLATGVVRLCAPAPDPLLDAEAPDDEDPLDPTHHTDSPSPAP